MSEKGRRSRAWDEQHLTGALLPVRWVIRAFSSITLAVILLVLVSLYGISASVPVGLMVLGLSYAFYGLTILVAIGVLAVLPAWGLWKLLRPRGRGRAFASSVLAGLVLSTVAVFLWGRYAWPALHYDPKTGAGVQFFSGFVELYDSTTLRRLPGMEMSELQYYAWWPLQVVLMLFVVNMVTATVRRIEFNFKNIGVLTVHTGIVVIALGSAYYAGLKKEGDTLLVAGPLDPESGRPTVGPSQDRFYDNTDVALYLSQGRGWEQRLLTGVPRYNHYNLGAFEGESAWELAGLHRPWFDRARVGKGQDPRRELDEAVVRADTGLVDDDFAFRLVGYCYYGETVTDWRRVPRTASAVVMEGARDNPLRVVFMHSGLPAPDGSVTKDEPVFAFTLPPKEPAQRIAVSRDRDSNRPVLSIEYTLGERAGMPAQRWEDLTVQLPPGTLHALVVEVPGAEGAAPARVVAPVHVGSVVRSAGYSVRVKELLPEPPFPIITEGYRDATSSVAVVEVTTPKGESFERYVYHRFPSLDQDILGTQADGRPDRRDASPELRVALVESDHLSVYIDEPNADGGATRVAMRRTGGELVVIDDLAAAQTQADLSLASGEWIRNIVDKISLRIGARWEHAQRTERPNPVPLDDQERENVGNHKKALLAVEVTSARLPGWKVVEWLPFNQYMGFGLSKDRVIMTPDGRRLTLAFGRLQHQFPNFAIQLADFQMISYDHRGAPRDYQSLVRVAPVHSVRERPDFEAYEHVTQLNAPLMAPFLWSEERSFAANLLGRLASGLSPHQFKLSQAGWDQQGWTRTQEQADAGLIKSPYAQFTILGVGNNPGIHVIAFGAVLMGAGIPWAFYVKPWLVRREKRRWAQEAARRKAAQAQGSTTAPSGTTAPAPAMALASPAHAPSPAELVSKP